MHGKSRLVSSFTKLGRLFSLMILILRSTTPHTIYRNIMVCVVIILLSTSICAFPLAVSMALR